MRKKAALPRPQPRILILVTCGLCEDDGQGLSPLGEKQVAQIANQLCKAGHTEIHKVVCPQQAPKVIMDTTNILVAKHDKCAKPSALPTGSLPILQSEKYRETLLGRYLRVRSELEFTALGIKGMLKYHKPRTLERAGWVMATELRDMRLLIDPGQTLVVPTFPELGILASRSLVSSANAAMTIKYLGGGYAVVLEITPSGTVRLQQSLGPWGL